MSEAKLCLKYEGWFMCRLATDPDPTDEPRGVSGTTFAYGLEPDLDRVIRFHDVHGLTRSHCPVVGVFVKEATINGTPIPELESAKVELLGEPKFENRNFVLTMAGKEPIVPFDVQISSGAISFSKSMRMSEHTDDMMQMPRETLHKYGGRGFYTADEKVLSAMKIHDPLENRKERKSALNAQLLATTDELEREILARRISEISKAIDDPNNERLVNMWAIEEFSFRLDGELAHKGGAIAGYTIADDAWEIDFWFGGWDPDALCGYTSGEVSIPLRKVS